MVSGETNILKKILFLSILPLPRLHVPVGLKSIKDSSLKMSAGAPFEAANNDDDAAPVVAAGVVVV